MSSLEAVLAQAQKLSTRDKVRLIEKVMPAIEREVDRTETKPYRSLWGACRDLGPAPSAEDIEEARREAWSSFPRSVE